MAEILRFETRGDYKKTSKFLSGLVGRHYERLLEKYAQQGVAALSAATPKDTGKTAGSWDYEIKMEGDRLVVEWTNSNVNKHVNIALILQYGHGTRNGGWVEGTDYINPAMKPIFDKMAEVAWKELSE